ncbi:MAG: tetratricopeptide repeat protein [Bacteroidia bacterium]|nr:tetratricopeptide repeat protein [Bacteroidia bacterium]
MFQGIKKNLYLRLYCSTMANDSNIISLIQNLNEEEIKAVHFLLVKHTLSSKKSQEQVLFEYLIKNKKSNITDEIIAEMLNTNRPDMVKEKLEPIVFDALCLHQHFENESNFNQYDSISLKLKKEVLAVKALHRSNNKGIIKFLIQSIENIISETKKYEIYDTLTEALTLKKYLISIRQGPEKFNEIANEIKRYEYCYQALIYATDCYYKLAFEDEFIAELSDERKIKQIKKCIVQIEKDYSNSQSQTIHYYLEKIKIIYHEKKKEYKKAIQICEKLIPQLIDNVIIGRKERIGFVYDYLCRYYSYLNRYKLAAAAAQNARKYYIEDSFNYLISKEQEFFAHFYAKHLEKATLCSTVMLNHNLADSGEFRKSKYIYYQACILFEQKNYKCALALLSQSLEIEKDKTRWNISVRILHIMLFIELNMINEAERAIEALRKNIERLQKDKEIRARDIEIIHLLREMEKDGYSYNPKNTKAKSIVDKLSSTKTEFAWEHFSQELIPFHQWVLSKKM